MSRERTDRKGRYRLYTREGSPFLWAEIRIPGQRKIRCSTGQRDRQRAEEFARSKLEAAAGVSFREAVVAFFEAAPLKPKSRERYLQSLRKVDPLFGARTLHEIGKADLQAYVADQKALGKSNSTIRRDLAFISTVFTWSRDLFDNAPDLNPVQLLNKRQLREVKRRRYLSRQEFARLIEATTEAAHAACLVIAVETGMRLGELLALEWSFVDLDRQTVTLPERLTKTGEPRVVPLSDTAADTLRGLDRGHGTQWVFTWRDWRGQVRPMRSIKKWWDGARRRAEVEDVRFHDLRHTFASWWRQEGGHDPSLMMMLGHSSREMTDRYAHLDATSLIDSMRRMGRISRDTFGTHSQGKKNTEGGKSMKKE